MNWKEILEKLNAKRAELAAIFAKAATKVDGQDRYNLTPEQLEDVKARNAEIDDLARQVEEAKAVDEIFQKNQKAIRDDNTPASHLPLGGGEPKGRGQKDAREAKSLGQMFTESESYLKRSNSKNFEVILPDVDFLQQKTLMETGAGYAPQPIRTGRIVEYAHRRLVVADIIPQSNTDQSAVVYMEETTSTNAAATKAEGAAAGESALVFTERNDPVREIATFLPVTQVQLEDVAGLQSFIDRRLLNFLELTKEVQLLTGDGNAPNLTGFNVKSGVQTQAKGSDPVPDAIYKGITKVRSTGMAEPSGIVLHPNDWQDVRLLRTTDGIYIWGNPSEAGPERIWGLPVVPTTAQTENTALLGDFQLYSEIRNRRGSNIKVSDSHSDYFTKGILAIRADMRLALVIYRAAAFCKVTGI